MRLSHFFVDRPIFAAVLSAILFLIGAISLFGLGVTVGPDYSPPETTDPAGFANARENDFTAAAVEARWWARFEDPALDALVRRALHANHDLRIAAARVREARATIAMPRSTGCPPSRPRRRRATSR